MISLNKIIKSCVIVSLACNSLVAAELVEDTITTSSRDGIVEPRFGEDDGGANNGLLCHIPPAVEGFDLEAFVDGTWYVQDATPTAFVSEPDRCITAQYIILDTPTEQGWTIEVRNRSENQKGKDNKDGDLCGIPASSTKLEGTGTLQVAPCYLPPTAIKPNYFVLAYQSTTPEFALIASGTQAAISDPNCGCSAPTGGLFIFTRAQERNEIVIAVVRSIAKDFGYGLCDLFEVDQENC